MSVQLPDPNDKSEEGWTLWLGILIGIIGIPLLALIIGAGIGVLWDIITHTTPLILK